MVGTVISLVAFAVSIFALVDGKRRDRRDLLLRLHEQLISEERQVGRRLLYQVGDRPIDQLDEDDFARINAALDSVLYLLQTSCHHGHYDCFKCTTAA